MQIMEGDLIATIRKNIEYIGHFHTAGVPGRHELDENQEIYYPAGYEGDCRGWIYGLCGPRVYPRARPGRVARTSDKNL